MTPSPPPPPLNDVVDFNKITFTNTDGGIFADVEFRQPSHALYEAVDFYYRRSASTGPWQFVEVRDKPGANAVITFSIGPLIIPAGFDATVSVYDIRAIVKYSTGERSTQFVTAQFTPSASSGTSVNPSEIIQITQTAWTTPTTTLQGTSARNNTIAVRALVPDSGAASIGSAGSTRTIRLVFRDDVLNQPENWQIDGVAIYWKPASATYWNRVRVKIPGTFVPGRDNTINFAGDIGIVGGPVNYDFIFRWYYIDATESTQQLRVQYAVESPFAVYPYDPAYGKNAVNEASTAYAFTTIDNAPADVVGAAANVAIGVNFIGGSYTNGDTQLNMQLEPPAAADLASYYRGVSVQYRAVVPGGNPPLIVANTVPQVNSQTGRFQLSPAVRPWTFDQKYEMIVTPIVLLPGGNKGYSNVSVRGIGYVHNRTAAADYPITNNWAPVWNFEQMQTQRALGLAGQSFPSGSPCVSLQDVTGITGSGYSTSPEVIALSTGQMRINQFMRVRFFKPAVGDYVKTWIYRRRAGAYVTTIGGGQFGNSLYWGLGRWERVEVTDASHPPAANGLVTVNLRGPIDRTEFDPYYQVPGYTGRNLIDSTWTGARVGQGYKSGRRPYAGLNIKQSDRYIEVLIVVETTSGLSDRAVRFVPDNIGVTAVTAEVNLIPTNRPEIVAYTEYNNLTAGYNRRLDEVSTPLTVSQLQYRTPTGANAPIYTAATDSDTNPMVYIAATPAVI